MRREVEKEEECSLTWVLRRGSGQRRRTENGNVSRSGLTKDDRHDYLRSPSRWEAWWSMSRAVVVSYCRAGMEVFRGGSRFVD